MRELAEVEGSATGVDVLVVGNGPSRLDAEEEIVGFPGQVVACNSFWRHGIRRVDYLVTLDRHQAYLALGEEARPSWETLAIPEHHLPWSPLRSASRKLDPSWFEGVEDRILALPYRTASVDKFARELRRGLPFWPSKPREQAGGFAGNLSGFLAFELAMVLAPRRIFLLGLDVSGRPTGEGAVVSTTACEPRWEGYEAHPVPRERCRQLDDGSLQPLGWRQYEELWRELSRIAVEAGIEVLRVRATGAMTWLPTGDPRSVADPHERVSTDRRR